MQFEFNNQLLPQNILDVEEIGEFAVECMNDEGYSYFLIIRTVLGMTAVAQCGPVIPDIEILPSGFKSSLDKLPYKEDRIYKIINQFLNDPKKQITQAKLVDVSDAIRQFKDISVYLTQFNEESF